jgi:hypothetical protein
MNIENVHKKLGEARLFLGKMRERESLAFDKGQFDPHLSAFLNATRTVDYRLRHEQKKTYPKWRKAWDAKLTPAEDSLIKFMVDDRNVEVHGSGSGRSTKTEEIKVGNEYSDASGTVTTGGSGTLIASGLPGMGAIIHKPAYYFTISGAERKATEACAEYLALLERMVAQFEADHP